MQVWNAMDTHVAAVGGGVRLLAAWLHHGDGAVRICAVSLRVPSGRSWVFQISFPILFRGTVAGWPSCVHSTTPDCDIYNAGSHGSRQDHRGDGPSLPCAPQKRVTHPSLGRSLSSDEPGMLRVPSAEQELLAEGQTSTRDHTIPASDRGGTRRDVRKCGSLTFDQFDEAACPVCRIAL